MNQRFTRRHLIGVIGASSAIALAGCLGGDDDDQTDDDTTDDDSAGNGSETQDDSADGDDHPTDDPETPGSEGLAYALTPEEIVLIDPEAGEVVETVASELGERNWGDIRYHAETDQLFVVDGRLNEVVVVDTKTRELTGEVPVGSGALHAYFATPDELWVHADEEGTFYVVDTATLSVDETVESGLSGEGHGKLTHHEDIGPMVYASNVNDPAALVIDTASYERVDEIELAQVGGTHYVQYSPANGMVYYEVQGVGTSVFDPDAGEEVDNLDAVGGLALSPDETVLGLWTGDEVQFFDATSAETDHLGTVEIGDGGPDDIEFAEADGTLYAFVPTVSGVSVVDVDTAEFVTAVEAGAFDEDASFASRAVEHADGVVLVTADLDGTVSVIDAGTHELQGEIEVGKGVDTLRYIPTAP